MAKQGISNQVNVTKLLKNAGIPRELRSDLKPLAVAVLDQSNLNDLGRVGDRALRSLQGRGELLRRSGKTPDEMISLTFGAAEKVRGELLLA